MSARAKIVDNHYQKQIVKLTQERDTALRDAERIKKLWMVNMDQLGKIGYEQVMACRELTTLLLELAASESTATESTLIAIRTALGCPELQVEELAGKVEFIVKAANVTFEAGQISMKAAAAEIAELRTTNQNLDDWPRDHRGYLYRYGKQVGREIVAAILSIPIHPKEG